MSAGQPAARQLLQHSERRVLVLALVLVSQPGLGGPRGQMRSQCSGAVLCMWQKNGSGRPFPSQRERASSGTRFLGRRILSSCISVTLHTCPCVRRLDNGSVPKVRLACVWFRPANWIVLRSLTACILRNCGTSSVAPPFHNNLICWIVVLWTYCEREF
jgi:hypothetical protein